MSTIHYTRIVADENVPREVVHRLRDVGCKEVYWISESKPGISDPEVWRLAAAKQAILLTGDIRFLPQLEEGDYLSGPPVVEYAANGFNKSELQDPSVMTFLVSWIFENGHHMGGDHVRLLVDGIARTRKQMWGQEKARRKRQV
jgi:hypothetical protein